MKDIIVIDVTRLAPRDKNPNRMPDEQFKMLVGAIKRVGFLQPLLVRPVVEGPSSRNPLGARVTDDYEIVDGVHRWRAAKDAGLTELPCVVVDSDDAEAAALQIGMNRLRGELDLHGVAVALGELREVGWTKQEMTLTGFSLPEIDDLLKTLAPAPDVDAAADVGEQPPETSPSTFELVIPFASQKDLTAARRKLKRLGSGDLAAGLERLFDIADGGGH